MKAYTSDIMLFDVHDAIGKHILELYPDRKPEESTILNALKGLPTLGKETIQTAFNGETCVFFEHTIPIKIRDKIVGAVSFAKYAVSFKRELSVKSPNDFQKPFYCLEDIIGDSLLIRQLKNQIASVTKTNSSVLIYGETGTGKELVAQSIHSGGERRNSIFLSQNCSAIPLSLLEGLLFGTVKGSFTGAEDKAGIFEIANGGTIFLDEINSMDMSMQAKILKVIEEKKVTRLGSNKAIPVDVRIISAMNEDPLNCVRQGRMRSDLYYRIGTVLLRVPPLKERPDDIPVLVNYYIDHYNKEMGKSIKGVTDEVALSLRSYDWPGNVRELRNAIEAAFNFETEDYITYDHLPPLMPCSQSPISFGGSPGSNIQIPLVRTGQTLTQMVDSYEKRCIENEVSLASSLNELASNLGISRQSLSYKLKKHNIVLPK